MGAIIPIIAGQLVSLIGTSIQSMAIPLYILNMTGSALLVGISQIITIAVTVIMSPIAGVVGDRYNKKRLLVGSDLISGTVVLGVFVLFSSGFSGLPFIFLCQALCAASECMLISSLFAIIPDIVSGRDITRANALRGMGSSIALFVGPMAGGLVYGLFGMKYVFLINAVSFFFSAALAGFLHYRRCEGAAVGELSFRVFVSDLKEIIRYLKENTGIRKIARFAVILNMASAPVLYVIIPFLIVTVLKMSNQQYGFIQGFYMAGFFLGGLLLGAVKLKNITKLVRPALVVMSVATLLLSVVSLIPVAPELLGVLGSMAAVTAMVVLLGCGDAVSGTIVQSEIQSTARPDVVSRIGGVLNMAFQAPMIVGLLVVSPLIDHVLPLYWVFIPIAVFLLFFTVFSSRHLFTGAPTQATGMDSSATE